MQVNTKTASVITSERNLGNTMKQTRENRENDPYWNNSMKEFSSLCNSEIFCENYNFYSSFSYRLNSKNYIENSKTAHLAYLNCQQSCFCKNVIYVFLSIFFIPENVMPMMTIFC